MQITVTINPDVPRDVQDLKRIYEALSTRNNPEPEKPADKLPWEDQSPFPEKPESKPKPKPETEPAPKRDLKEIKASIKKLGLEIVAKGQEAKEVFWNLLTGVGTPTVAPATHPKIGDIPDNQLEAVEAAMKEMLVKLHG